MAVHLYLARLLRRHALCAIRCTSAKELIMQSDRHITLKCGTVLRLPDLEAAGLSYVPCGQINGEDKPLLSFGHLWGHRRHITHQTYDKKWNAFTIGNMTGVQLMTGFPTYKRSDGYLYLYYTSIDIERRMIENFPEAVAKIRTLYEENVEGSPCILATKSDGLRLDAYTEYVGKKMSFKDDEKKMLFEVLADKCLARIDHRYAMISGSILNIPTLPKATLQKIYHIIAEISTHEQSDDKPREVVEKAQIGDLDIQWDADGRSQYFTTEHCQETSHASNRYEVRFTKHADGSVDGKCFNCGESWWEVEPTQRHRSAPVRLKVSECERETQSLEEQREMLGRRIQEVVAEKRETEGQHVVNVTSAAGTGKTTVTITTYDNLLFLNKTTEEADQAFSIADALEKDCWRHRPRMHNFKDDNWDEMPFGLGQNEHPCLYPKVCNDLVSRGHDVVPTFCAQRCEFYAECRDQGFLKQLEIEPAKQSVFMSWDEMVFSDVRLASRVKKICAGEKLLVLDEANATQLPQRREIPTKDLLDILESWRLPVPAVYDLFIFLDMLIKELSTTKKPEQIRAAFQKCLGMLTDDYIAAFDDALSKIPVGLVYERDAEGYLFATAIYGDNIEKRLCVSDDETPPKGFDGTIPEDFARDGVEIDTLKLFKVDLDLFERFGFIDMRRDSHNVPRRWVNFVADIKAFVDSGSKACFKDETGNIEFYLPPGLNAPLGLTLTASDTDDLISEVYRPTDISVTTITAPPPPFMPGCKIFQIATGRYTAKSALIEKDPDNTKTTYKPDGSEVVETAWKPKPILKRMLKAILTAARKPKDADESDKVRFRDALVVAAKDIVENTADPLLDDIRENSFFHFTNHHHAEGRNDYQHCEVAFIFHSEPAITELQKIAQIAFPTETLSFEREAMNISVDGVTLEKVMRYTDERVQKVYNRECESRLMQAMMRLRPMLHENKLIFLFTAEPVQRIPVAPIPFTLKQLERFLFEEDGDIVDFEAYLQELEALDVKEIAEVEGLKKSQAYKKTEEKRKQTDEDLKAEAYRLASEENLNQQEIADRLGKGLATINRWIKESQKHAKTEADAQLLWKIEEMLHQGYTQRTAAKMIGISLGKLQSLLKKRGVT